MDRHGDDMEIRTPDVSALYLEEALEILKKSGARIKEIVKTQPPAFIRGAEEMKKLRVVLATQRDNEGVSLLVTPAHDVEECFRGSH